jgi:hypothetical protein
MPARRSTGASANIITDTNGLLVGAQVRDADIQDRDSAVGVLASIRYFFPGCATSSPMAVMLVKSWRRPSPGRGNGRLPSSSDHMGPEAFACFPGVGSRANIRLTWPQPAAGKGLRGDDRQRRGMFDLASVQLLARRLARSGYH